MADSISDLQKDTFYWQRLLRLAGYYHGAIDGIPGNGTRNGTERWSTDADRYKWRPDALTNAPNGTSPPFFRKRKSRPAVVQTGPE